MTNMRQVNIRPIPDKNQSVLFYIFSLKLLQMKLMLQVLCSE